MTARRYLALYLPQLATERIRQREPALCGAPLATWSIQGNRRMLVGVDAPGTALHLGQALADAQATHPGLVLRPADPEGDLAFLARLALWATRFTPLAAVDPPDGLVLDVTGCAALFGGETALLAQVLGMLRRGGITAHAVIASVAEAAILLARAGHRQVVPPGREAAMTAALPLQVLRLPLACQAGLHQLGLRRIGEVLRQPRAPLARRFGRPLLDALDALTGERPRVLPSVRPPPAFIAALDFAEPIATRPAIEQALDTLLSRLCQALDQAGQGARRMTLRAFRVDRDVQDLTIGTLHPTRAPAPLRRLFDPVLERLAPDLGFERITLQADVTDVFDAAQSGMGTGDARAGQPHDHELAQVLDRLSQRLPVWRLAQADSHWPERSVVRAAAGPFGVAAPQWRRPGLPAPVLHPARKPALTVLARIAEGAPIRLQLKGTTHCITWADGPERIEPEWWRDPPDSPGLDLYRVELDSGARLCIGCISGQNAGWFLHGYLP